METEKKGLDYRHILNKLRQDYKSMVYIETEKQKDLTKLNDINRVKQLNDDEINEAKVAIAVLKSNYNNYKKETTLRLQQELSRTINRFFNNTYNLELESGVNRGKTTVDLVEKDDDGNSVGSLKMMLSGAEQQMAGFSTQKITLANLDGDFMILDEAFSSFGIPEMMQMADILRSVDDVQLILIEHKDLGDLKAPVYNISRKADGLVTSTRIVSTENLDMIDWEREFPTAEDRIKYYTSE